MRYFELINESTSDSFVQKILDLLTPIAAQGIEYVTVSQLIQKLSSIASGLYIDRELIMSVLDPNKLPLIKSIEGDKVYLTKMAGPGRSVSDQQADKEQETIHKTATKQAVKGATS